MDGTLFDSTLCVTSAYHDAVVAAGGPPPSPETVIAAYPLGPPRVILEHLIGRPATAADEICYLDALIAHQGSIVVYDGVVDLLSALDARNVPCAVFTGASAAAADGLLAVTDLRRLFRAVVGGDEVAAAKPAPDGVLLAAERLGFPAADCAYVGDSALDLQAAKAAGALAIGAGWGHLFDPRNPADLVLQRPMDLLVST
jgi:phosphoglycolate phosphatase/AHBA synthesis associated protein